MSSMPAPTPSEAINIFFSYAQSSPRDRRLFATLNKHLSGLRRLHPIARWYDSAVSSADHLTQTLENSLNEASIIIFLITVDFMDSKRCIELEMEKALELQQTRDTRLIPVLLAPADWTTLPLSQYQPLPADGKAVSSKRDREAAFTEVAVGIRKVVDELASQARRSFKRIFTPAAPVYHFPQRQNRLFTDRAALLAELHMCFFSAPPHQPARVALYGLGGMGKTQVAQEYLQRFSHLYRSVLWLNAETRETLSGEISALAGKLALSRKEQTSTDQLFAAFKGWLQRQTNWLLVLDHLDDLTLPEQIVPCEGNGHVLLTTRIRASEEATTTLPVERFEITDGATFLLRRAKILPAGATLAQAEQASIELASTIALAMDGFPLALDQAGAFLAETGCGLAKYLDLLQSDRATLLGRRGRLIDTRDHPASVLVTLSLTIEKVQALRPANLPLLHLLAFLQPDSIPYELLEAGAGEAREPLRRLLKHGPTLYEALGELQSYSLLHPLADSTTLSIHRMVQAVLVDTLTPRQRRQWASLVVRMVNRVFPATDFENWAACERYLPQAQHCAKLIATFHLPLAEGAQLLHRLGFYCYRQARYTEAESYLTQALTLHEAYTTADTQGTARILNTLGLLYYKLTRYTAAAEALQRALDLRQQALGPEDLQTAESLHNLALLYTSQGNYQQAEDYYRRVLTIEARALGPDHIDSARTLNNLALLCFKRSQYAQAEHMYRQALTIYEQTLPPDHPDLLYPLDGLGNLAELRGEYQQATAFYQRALEICERAFGELHPETALSLNKLADIYEAEDQDQQAEALYQRARRIGEQVWGTEHPDIAIFLNNLAYLAEKQGAYEQAEAYYQRALAINEQTPGGEHAAVADVLNNLGVLYRDTQRLERAEQLLRRALAIRSQPSQAPSDLAQSLSNLAELLMRRQAYAEAESLFQRAYTLRRQLLGSSHPLTVHTREKYAALLDLLQRPDDAAHLRQEATGEQEPGENSSPDGDAAASDQ